MNFKWDGKHTELHDFITLVLKRKVTSNQERLVVASRCNSFKTNWLMFLLTFGRRIKLQVSKGMRVLQRRLSTSLRE